MSKGAYRIGVILAVSAVLVTLAFVFHRPIRIRYHIFRYTVDSGSFLRGRPQLCDLGPETRAPLLERFHALEPNVEAGAFRVAVAQTLRCLRRDAVFQLVDHEGITFVRNADVPIDAEMVDTVVTAYREEPSPEMREELLGGMGDLDFRTRFTLHAKLLETPHPLPNLYAAPPFGHIDPDASAEDLRQILRELAPDVKLPPSLPRATNHRLAEKQAGPSTIDEVWCEVVAPAEYGRLNGSGPQTKTLTRFVSREIVTALVQRDCAGSHEAIAKRLEGLDRPLRAAEEALREAADDDDDGAPQDLSITPDSDVTLAIDFLRRVSMSMERDEHRASRYFTPILALEHSCTLSKQIDRALGYDFPHSVEFAPKVQEWRSKTRLRCKMAKLY